MGQHGAAFSLKSYVYRRFPSDREVVAQRRDLGMGRFRSTMAAVLRVSNRHAPTSGTIDFAGNIGGVIAGKEDVDGS